MKKTGLFIVLIGLVVVAYYGGSMLFSLVADPVKSENTNIISPASSATLYSQNRVVNSDGSITLRGLNKIG